MASMNENDARLTARLIDAVNTLADGSADRLGRMLGYTNGGYIREIVNGKKPVRRVLIERFNTAEDTRLHNWFTPVVTEGSAEASFMVRALPNVWATSGDPPPTLVDDFADRLLRLPENEHDNAVDACRRLAESPDSKRARQNLAALIGDAPSRHIRTENYDQVLVDVMSKLGMLADRWTVEAERAVVQRFVETANEFMREGQVSPGSGHAAAPAAQDRKAATREN